MVYVDNMNAKFGRMVMVHMIADSPEELRKLFAMVVATSDATQPRKRELIGGTNSMVPIFAA